MDHIPQIMQKRLDQFDEVINGLRLLYSEKNVRYKDSFAKQFSRQGLMTVSVRLYDKFSRAEALIENPEDDGNDESLEDTLKDLANYSIMTLMALNEMKQGGEI